MQHFDFPTIDIPEDILAHGFGTDDVYRHDVCPRLTRDGLSLWVDHADPAQRECHGARFTLHPHDEYMQCSGEIVEFETLPELLVHLEGLDVPSDTSRAFGPGRAAPAWWRA
jgi:hypothetical protein